MDAVAASVAEMESAEQGSTSTTSGARQQRPRPTSGSKPCAPPSVKPNRRSPPDRARIEALAVGLERNDGGALLEHAADGLLAPVSDLLTVEAGSNRPSPVRSVRPSTPSPPSTHWPLHVPSPP